jgi:MAX-like protein X
MLENIQIIVKVSMNNFAELSGCVFSWIEEQCKPGELQELMGAILRQVKTSRQC